MFIIIIIVFYCFGAIKCYKKMKYLSVDTTRTLFHAFIMGRIDYCNSLVQSPRKVSM